MILQCMANVCGAVAEKILTESARRCKQRTSKQPSKWPLRSHCHFGLDACKVLRECVSEKSERYDDERQESDASRPEEDKCLSGHHGPLDVSRENVHYGNPQHSCHAT